MSFTGKNPSVLERDNVYCWDFDEQTTKRNLARHYERRHPDKNPEWKLKLDKTTRRISSFFFWKVRAYVLGKSPCFWKVEACDLGKEVTKN